MTTRPGAVALRSVDKSFTVGGSEVAALRDVSLDVAPGEFVSLVGPSGCGKSTLLRLVAGLERPDEGMVRVDDQPILAPSLSRGIVFQDHRLFPWMTVEANVLLALHRSGLAPDARRERARALIALVGLGGFEDAHPDQLSGGMAQRAAIARSLAPRPRVLLLDEPLGALDSLTRARLQGDLLRIWEHEGVTMLKVTHDVEEAVFLSDRIVVLGDGPGRVRDVVPITLPRPRERADPAFVALRSNILALLSTLPRPAEASTAPAPVGRFSPRADHRIA
jgi:sulfonate transport system ATP-binding protein